MGGQREVNGLLMPDNTHQECILRGLNDRTLSVITLFGTIFSTIDKMSIFLGD